MEDIKHAGTESAFLQVEIRVRIKPKPYKWVKKCRNKFPELSIYTSFIAPRWVTNVGDFKSRQDAQKYVNLIRSAHFTYEVRIVSSEVNLPY